MQHTDLEELKADELPEPEFTTEPVQDQKSSPGLWEKMTNKLQVLNPFTREADTPCVEDFDPQLDWNEDTFGIHAAEQDRIDTGLVMHAMRLCEMLHDDFDVGQHMPTQRISLLLGDLVARADKEARGDKEGETSTTDDSR